MRLWRVGTNTLYILRTTGSWFVRFVVQPYIYSFQGSDRLILSRTTVRVKAIHPTTDFIRRGFLVEFYKKEETDGNIWRIYKKRFIQHQE